VRSEAKRMVGVMRAGKCPGAKIGPQCTDCPLYPDCWSFLPERHVFNLTNGREKCYDLMNRGILKVKNIPDSFPLSPKQAIQVACEKKRQPRIQREKIAEFLDRLSYPLYFLDFETYMIAVPPFDEMSPYEQVPFQYSLHVVSSPGARVEHFSYLSDGSADSRPEVLSTLKGQLGRKGSIIAYNAPFEIRVLDTCARHFPEYEKWNESIRPRFVDLLIPFRNFHYYHPDQEGSSSLKAVLPVLTGRSYEGLEIADGQAAALRFREMAFGNADASTKKSIRKALEEYCRQDAEGMLDIVKALQDICR